MPRYDYICDRCGAFELYRSMSQAEEVCPCPACGEQARRHYCRIGLLSGTREWRTRIEQSVIPKVVTASSPIDEAHSHNTRLHPPSRPWQLGH
ncbi:FmdB family zinc ribbon protein [Paenibacillus cymbidii]|uniref:FmdB family zinc ribbon protein n=1 Tax=Paenibacillus cymbidii TaxID=1639034 RepID=UPI00107FDED8|nr:zinc ribbon domain-containing protein [Paenibacillus cymbidii]